MARADFFAARTAHGPEPPAQLISTQQIIPKIKPGPPKAHSSMNLQPHLKEN